jgi:hypothetical protein
VTAAADAYWCREDDVFDELIGLLALGPGTPGGHEPIDRALAEAVSDRLAWAWEHGWQPVDIPRELGRKCSAAHRTLGAVAVVVEGRRYAPALVDPRWSDQLLALEDELGRTGAPAAGRRDHAWVAERGPTRREAVAVAVTTISLLRHLPELPMLCPPPGKGSWRGRPSHKADEALLRKVRALLAKAESTAFEEEAEALTAKAQDLMSRHAIDLIAVMSEDRRTEEPTGIRISVDDPYAQAKASLLARVADANRCRSVWSSDLGFSTVVGHVDDLELVEILYTSLLVQATAAMTSLGSRRDATGRSRTRSFRQSFLVAYATRNGERLDDAARAAETVGVGEHGTSLVPVLADRREAVDRARDALFPGMTRFNPRTGNMAGWVAGTAAADLAALWGADEVADRTG